MQIIPFKKKNKKKTCWSDPAVACGSGVGKVGEERYCLGCGVGYNTSHSGFFGRACVCADTFHKIGYQMFTVHPGSFGKALRPHRDTKTARKVSSYVLDFVRDVPLSYETGRICSVCFERYISAFTLLRLKKTPTQFCMLVPGLNLYYYACTDNLGQQLSSRSHDNHKITGWDF